MIWPLQVKVKSITDFVDYFCFMNIVISKAADVKSADNHMVQKPKQI